MRTIIALLLVGASVVPLAAQVKNPDTLTYATIGDSDSLDPVWSYDTFSEAVILNLYETLVAFDGASTERLVPLIATKVPSRANGLISPDGRTYTFPIRKGVRFHDGSEMTPEDVRYSILRFLLLDRDAGPSPLLLQPLLGIAGTRDAKGVLDPEAYKKAAQAVSVKGDSVVVTLPRPYAPLLTIFASWAPVVSQKWAAANGDWDGSEATWTKYNNFKKESSAFFEKANGTGPFQLERWDRRTKEIILGRNDRYWRAPARLRRVIIKGISEFGTRKLMLQAGDADVIYAMEPEFNQVKDIPGVRILDNLRLIEHNPIAFFTFRLNTAGNPYVGSGKLDGEGIPEDFFNDPDVRKAFSYAFDYPGYIRDVNRGKGTHPRGCIPRGLPGFSADQKTYDFDLAQAKAHFQKAFGGKVWENGFHFALVYNTGNGHRESFCQILKRSVESLNPKFRIDVRAIEWPTFLDAYIASKLPVFLIGWQADYPDAHDFVFPLMHSQGTFPGPQRYKNPEVDRLIDAAIAETDAGKRAKLYARIQQIEYEDAPHIIPVESVRFRTQRDWVQGWVHNPIYPGAPYDSYYYPIYKAAAKKGK